MSWTCLPLAAKNRAAHFSDARTFRLAMLENPAERMPVSLSGGGRCSGPLQPNFPEPIDSDRHEGVDFLALKRSRLHAIASEMMMTAAKKTWAKPQVKKLTDSEVQSLAEAHQPVREMLKSNPRTA